MHLVQLLLPLYDPQGRRFPPEPYAPIRAELTERIGWEPGPPQARPD